MQFCRFFSGGYAVTVAGDLSVALFLAAWRGSCTRRDFFALAVDARQGTRCQWRRVVSVCLPWMLWLHDALTIAVVFCHLNGLLSVLALRRKVGGGERNSERPSDSWRTAFTFAAEISISFDGLCWMRSICVVVLLLSSEMPMGWVPVDSLWKMNHIHWSSCVPYPQERRAVYLGVWRKIKQCHVTDVIRSLFKPGENLCNCCKLLPLVNRLY